MRRGKETTTAGRLATNRIAGPEACLTTSPALIGGSWSLYVVLRPAFPYAAAPPPRARPASNPGTRVGSKRRSPCHPSHQEMSVPVVPCPIYTPLIGCLGLALAIIFTSAVNWRRRPPCAAV